MPAEALPLAHIRPGEDYKALVYEEAQAGWHAGNGLHARAGIQAGTTVAQRVGINLRAGMAWTGWGTSAGFVPFYAALGTELRL